MPDGSSATKQDNLKQHPLKMKAKYFLDGTRKKKENANAF